MYKAPNQLQCNAAAAIAEARSGIPSEMKTHVITSDNNGAEIQKIP